MSIIRTTYFPQLVEHDKAIELYHHLKDNVDWQDGIKSKQGNTRKASSFELGIDDKFDQVVLNALFNIGNVNIYGIYLNYYRNGEDWTPNHSHPGMKQFIISLGATRQLTMGKKVYPMNNGDCMIFGSSVHGVPKDPQCITGRISIALFLEK